MEFYNLEYADPNEVSLGRQFKAIFPLLWLAAGAQTKRPACNVPKEWYIPQGCSFAVLLDMDKFIAFSKALD